MRTASIDLVLDSNHGKSMLLLPFMQWHLGSDIEIRVIYGAVDQILQIWYGERWDGICDSCHSGTPGLALCQYRRVSWHWFQGLSQDSYLNITFSIFLDIHWTWLWKSWYLGNYLAWDLETSVNLRAGIDLMPTPGFPNDMNLKYHPTFRHIRSVCRLSSSSYS